MNHDLFLFECELKSRGLDENIIEDYKLSLKDHIHTQVQEYLSQILIELKEIAIERDAIEFLQQIKLDDFGDYVQISTFSGNLDFIRPGYPNLPFLLENAKLSKDGVHYKVIPIGAKKPHTKTISIKDVEHSLSNMSEYSPMQDVTKSIANSFNSNHKINTILINKSESAEPTAYRTATSKQDPNISWKIPPKTIEMSAIVMDYNNRIKNGITNIIKNSTSYYLSRL